MSVVQDGVCPVEHAVTMGLRPSPTAHGMVCAVAYADSRDYASSNKCFAAVQRDILKRLVGN